MRSCIHLSRSCCIIIGLIFLVQLSYAQALRTIQGVVRLQDGTAAANVSVSIKNSQQGTSTNEAGEFRLQASNAAVLQFRLLGYQTQEVTVGTQSTINVVLVENQENLDEVVVVGYGTQSWYHKAKGEVRIWERGSSPGSCWRRSACI